MAGTISNKKLLYFHIVEVALHACESLGPHVDSKYAECR
jgi:hypothetical protein